MIGATADGEPVITVSAARAARQRGEPRVRLVLPAGRRHFRKLATCPECGREFVRHGHAVMSPEDLTTDAPRRCDHCFEERMGPLWASESPPGAYD